LLAAVLLASFSARAAADGRNIYVQACAHCHESGVGGAPRTGDRRAWASRLSNGEQALVTSVLRGNRGMPPKGGNANLTDGQARAAVKYMLSSVR
jgi:cytochrome c5